MQCEICGAETRKPVRIVVDGSHLAVCDGCSECGSKEPGMFAQKKKVVEERHSILEEEDGLLPDSSSIIRKAREQKGLTIEELGKKVFEKASFLHRIEAGAAKPSPQLAAKIEKELGIKITG